MEETIRLVNLSRAVRALVHRASQSTRFKRGYALGGLAVLIVTTLFWAILGARLQAHNADQLSDAYLFANWPTFHGASFPGAHTFLLKWPIFWLVSVVGITPHTLLVATVATVLVTVLGLAALLYKIDRRPVVFGTVCLGLSLALLLVPAQPYAGGILPVNMAMLTTRNLEYITYLVALVLFVRAWRIRTVAFWAGVLVLTLLVASDKLFLSLSAGGALLALAVYALLSNWNLVAFAARWLAGTLLAAVGSVVLLATISGMHLTHLVNNTSANPYGFIQGSKDLSLGAVYAVTGLLTNAGANPAYDNRVAAHLPHDVLYGFLNWRGPVYMVALAVLLYAASMAWRVLWPTLKPVPRDGTVNTPRATLLALSLLWSSAAAIVVFIATNHYFPVDARYLTISLFALAVAAVTHIRQREWLRPHAALYVASALTLALALGTVITIHTYNQQKAPFTALENRDNLVAQTLQRHKVDVLVGDYWRVLPIKAAAHGALNTTPLGGCLAPNESLTSTAWQPDLTKHSFAYLLTLDGSLTNFPQCSLPQVTAAYGRPLSTQVIAGTLAHPKEVLLFYDVGAHRPPASLSTVTAQASLTPVTLSGLSNTGCDQPTTVNVVAHEDDDLLFLSPDLLHDLRSGRCVRTIYLTAGDSGVGKLRWISRQLGAEAAYSNLLGLHKNVWEQQTVRLSLGEYITVANPLGNSKVSLVFINLPDGNLHGDGFPATGDESLAKLYTNQIGTLQSVDGQSSYTAVQLVSALTQLMGAYQPATIHTQADVPSGQFPDHSDHIATSKFTVDAARQYDTQHFGSAVTIPVVRYIGYPIHGYAGNVAGDDLVTKEAAFLAYAQYDGGVCQTVIMCARTPTYGAYLSRQYTENSMQP